VASGSLHRRGVLGGLALAAGGARFAHAQAEQLARSPGAVLQHPGYAAATRWMDAGDWTSLASAVAALPPQSAFVLISELGDTRPFGGAFGALLDQPMGCTIAGGVEIGWAWRFRGAGTAETVTEAGARRSYERLRVARDYLDQAARRDKDDGVAHAFAIRAAKGLGDLSALAGARFDLLTAGRRPVAGLAGYIDAISPKWLGSEEECLSFARRFSRLAPRANCGLLPDAHFACFSAREVEGLEPSEQAAYFVNAPVRTELMEANARFLDGLPDADPFADWYANAAFSFAFVMMEERALARQHLLAMGSYIGGPWGDYDDPRAAIARARSAVGLEAL
jgi:hypothetical protein